MSAASARRHRDDDELQAGRGERDVAVLGLLGHERRDADVERADPGDVLGVDDRRRTLVVVGHVDRQALVPTLRRSVQASTTRAAMPASASLPQARGS